jgi:outer membrane protein assembly factor BamB
VLRIDRAAGRLLAWIALLPLLALPTSAQVVYSDTYPDNYPPPLPKRKGPQPPPVTLEWIGEVPLEGPLRAGPLAATPDRVVVPSPGGVWLVEPAEGGSAARETGGTAPQEDDPFRWVLDAEGRVRCRAAPEGGLVVEKRRGPKSRWREDWRLPTAAPLSAPPVPVGRRVIFTSSDGRVTAARLSNGHRIWATDMGERLSRGSVLWSGVLGPPNGAASSKPETHSFLLIVPDSGVALLAIDVYDGRVVARGEIPGGRGRLVSPPLLLADGRIAASRQGYALDDAGLGLFRLRVAEKKAAPEVAGGVPYNDAPDSPEDPPSRR